VVSRLSWPNADVFLNTQEGRDVLAATRDGLREGRWEHADAICQPHHSWTEEDFAIFAVVQGRISSGQIGVTAIEIGDYASADTERHANQAALDRAPHPFRFLVDEGQYGSPLGDGAVSWSEPIQTDSFVDGETVQHLVPPRDGVPLEIGTTRSKVTVRHLMQFGAVVRWPYDHDTAWLLYSLAPWPTGAPVDH
jgi:hypothetical protein